MAEVRVPAIEFHQRNIRLYLFSMKANRLAQLVKSHARLSSDQEGIQRLLDKKRLESIAEYVSAQNTALPNNIIVNLNNKVRFESSGANGIGNLVFPEDEGHFGDVLDGQHRLYGVVHTDSSMKDLELAVTGIVLSDAKLAGKIFADINSNQKPVSKVLLVSLQRELGALPDAKDSAAAIVERLNEDKDSPLYDKIQMFQDEKNKWLTNDQAINIMVGLLHPSKTLSYLSTDRAVSQLKSYLQAVETVFHRAWGNNRDYRLTRSAGLEIVLGLFERVKERTREMMPSKEQFEQSLSPIVDARWDAETFRDMGYTSSGGRIRYRDDLLLKLPPPGVSE